MAEFLFEIGFEEMPAPWLSGLADQLKTKFCALAEAEQLAPSDALVLWTSRRLVLVAQVKARQDDRTVVEWGPAARIAKDAAGNWSKAAEGFARKQGVDLNALTLAAKAQGSSDLYVSATKHVAGRPSLDVLADLAPALLRGINFPKRMNWDAWLEDGRGAFEFGRPIQWIVALLDAAVVPVCIFDAVGGAKGAARVVSGQRSMGHRFYPRDAADRGFEVASFKDLEDGLASRYVILDPRARAERIRAQVIAAGGEVSGKATELLHEWSDLVEYPTVVVGSIPIEFADLPDEVLDTVLAHHQKAITLPRGENGEPRFAAISGGDEGASLSAALGQERVVVARLKDARFFYEEDQKRTLESRVDDLAAVTFHRGLGNYREKAIRVSARSAAFAQEAGHGPAVSESAGRAGRLAKADLVTQMVREFPELQGVMGGLYVQANESADVAAAIRWHYHPVSTEIDGAPAGHLNAASTEVFAAVALADKLDTLVGYFGLGQIPSGSSDPYGLRRAGQGAVRILLDFWTGKNPDLQKAIADLYAGFGGALTKPVAEVQSSLVAFLGDRLRAILTARGFRSDEVDAVLSAPRMEALSDVRGAVERLRALSTVRSEQPEVFAALAESFKRAKNIVGDRASGEVAEAAFVEDAEGALHAAITRAETVPATDPAARLRAIASIRSDVEAFFKGVMVMSEDIALRTNRLALLTRLLDLVYEVADLSKLAAPAGENAASI